MYCKSPISDSKSWRPSIFQSEWKWSNWDYLWNKLFYLSFSRESANIVKKTQQKISINGLTNFPLRPEHWNLFSIFLFVPIFSYFFIMMNLDLISSIFLTIECHSFWEIFNITNCKMQNISQDLFHFQFFRFSSENSFLINLSFFESYGNISNALEKEHIFFFLLAENFPVYFSPKLYYLVRGRNSPIIYFFLISFLFVTLKLISIEDNWKISRMRIWLTFRSWC